MSPGQEEFTQHCSRRPQTKTALPRGRALVPGSCLRILMESASPRMLQRTQISQGAAPDLQRIEVSLSLRRLEMTSRKRGDMFCSVYCAAGLVCIVCLFAREKSGRAFSPTLNYLAESPSLPLLFVPRDRYAIRFALDLTRWPSGCGPAGPVRAWPGLSHT